MAWCSPCPAASLQAAGCTCRMLGVEKRAPKNKIFYQYLKTTAVIYHEITTRRADAELLSRVDVVEQMETGSAVARTSSRAACSCAADAAPPRYPQVQEEASRSGLLGPRRRPRAWRTGGRHGSPAHRYCSVVYCSPTHN